MLMNSHFNPLEYARQLEAEGVPKSQAEVHANTLLQALDNYAQVNDLKHEVGEAISAAEVRLRAEIAASGARLEAKIEESEMRLQTNTQTETRALRSELQSEIHAMCSELTRLRWANGVLIALSIAILAQGYFR